MDEQQEEQPVYMALDIGGRRIGVAVASPDGGFALPLETVDMKANKDRRVGYMRIVELIDARGVTHVVVGWPLTLEGKTGRATDRVSRFIQSLTQCLDDRAVEFIYWDERLTTIAAESFLIGEDVSRSRRKEVVDQIAATHILEGFLSSLPK